MLGDLEILSHLDRQHVLLQFHFIFIMNFLGMVALQLEKTDLQGGHAINALKAKLNILHVKCLMLLHF